MQAVPQAHPFKARFQRTVLEPDLLHPRHLHPPPFTALITSRILLHSHLRSTASFRILLLSHIRNNNVTLPFPFLHAHIRPRASWRPLGAPALVSPPTTPSVHVCPTLHTCTQAVLGVAAAGVALHRLVVLLVLLASGWVDRRLGNGPLGRMIGEERGRRAMLERGGSALRLTRGSLGGWILMPGAAVVWDLCGLTLGAQAACGKWPVDDVCMAHCRLGVCVCHTWSWTVLCVYGNLAAHAPNW
eukprot:821086-Pelagomonas_calceolata.AAC.3